MWICPGLVHLPQAVVASDAAEPHKVPSLEENCLPGCDAALCDRSTTVSEESADIIYTAEECSFTWILVYVVLMLHIKYLLASMIILAC